MDIQIVSQRLDDYENKYTLFLVNIHVSMIRDLLGANTRSERMVFVYREYFLRRGNHEWK